MKYRTLHLCTVKIALVARTAGKVCVVAYVTPEIPVAHVLAAQFGPGSRFCSVAWFCDTVIHVHKICHPLVVVLL